MIRESIIENVLGELGESSFDFEFEQFKSKYPVIHAYLLNEQLSMLTEEEFKLFFFSALVIVRSVEKVKQIPDKIDESKLEELESSNWALLENSKPGGFREKLDVFFKNSTQEDLLAFIEDSLEEDEDFSFSSAAKEIAFVSLKSLVDLFESI